MIPFTPYQYYNVFISIVLSIKDSPINLFTKKRKNI